MNKVAFWFTGFNLCELVDVTEVPCWKAVPIGFWAWGPGVDPRPWGVHCGRWHPERLHLGSQLASSGWQPLCPTGNLPKSSMLVWHPHLGTFTARSCYIPVSSLRRSISYLEVLEHGVGSCYMSLEWMNSTAGNITHPSFRESGHLLGVYVIPIDITVLTCLDPG